MSVSLAATGRFADPFGYPSGPTAHVGMLTPVPSAFVYWLFDGDSPHADFIFYCRAAFLVCPSIWLCWRLAVVVGRSARHVLLDDSMPPAVDPPLIATP